jgi:isocitrate lyase
LDFFERKKLRRPQMTKHTNGNGNGNSNHMNMQNPWESHPRWAGITRPYSPEKVARLRGSFAIEHTLARLGAERLWKLLHEEPYVAALGALTGNQAVQQVQAGLKAIYASGWQVAADANDAGEMYPDQSLYPSDSCPNLVRKLNNAMLRADQVDSVEGRMDTYWLAPIVADAEAGFGGSLNAFELMKAMIEAGAAGVHFEDQLSSAKKCGHLGGKVVVPTREFIEKLVAARLAADVMGTPTILVARTDADSAGLLLSDADPADHPFIASRERTPEGFFPFRGGIEAAIARGLAYAPYADMIWCETQLRISMKHASSPMRSTRNFPASCSLTIAPLQLIGRRNSMPPQLRASNVSSAPWATNSSSLHWPASMR